MVLKKGKKAFILNFAILKIVYNNFGKLIFISLKFFTNILNNF